MVHVGLRSVSPRLNGPDALIGAAIGHKAELFTTFHPLDYDYGAGSPFAKLVSENGKILMIGAPLDTISIFHHAEHLAQLPGK